MSSTTRTSLLSLCLLLLTAGCVALPPGKRDPRDPWEQVNRATYRFNDKFDRAIARPVARGYRAATPHFVQTGIRNVYDNVDTPIVMLNDLLQGQFKPFASDTGRPPVFPSTRPAPHAAALPRPCSRPFRLKQAVPQVSHPLRYTAGHTG